MITDFFNARKIPTLTEANENARQFGVEIGKNLIDPISLEYRKLQPKFQHSSFSSIYTSQLGQINQNFKRLPIPSNSTMIEENPDKENMQLPSFLQIEEEKNPSTDPLNVPAYIDQIISFVLSQEELTLIKQNYFLFQTEIKEKMRAILVDWLVDVHAKFKMVPETLYLSVNLLDRYLELTNITKQQLQLVGIACMLIASKYEEIYPPECKDFIWVTDNAYNKTELLEMEGKIL